jgi:Mn2+/Fe2+ NRAMP family transporter
MFRLKNLEPRLLSKRFDCPAKGRVTDRKVKNMSGNANTQQASPIKIGMNPRIERDRELLINARKKGRFATLKAFIRLSGPGWLQSGITLGGGSLSSCLYLGMLVGFSFLWLQPAAMILGVIMLGAIAYVTLSIGQRPVSAINTHVNPVLGWGWLLASMTANMVWSMPQFGIGIAAIRQNLLPGLLGPEVMPEMQGRILAACCFLAICLTGSMLYGIGGWGMKVYETLIKGMVTMVVLCFLGVIIKLSIEGAFNLGQILRGLVPDFGLLFRPVDAFASAIGAVAPQCQEFWRSLIVGQQRDVMISAAAAAVGINMTFMLPYSMLRKGWDRNFRGLAIFDLSTGLFIPFILATGFVVIASASQFHARAAQGFVGETPDAKATVQPAKNLVEPYNELLAQRIKYEIGEETFAKLSEAEKKLRTDSLPFADKKMAAMLVKRDAFNLADTLAPLVGKNFAQYVFGLGVLGMVTGAATMLMTINGLCLCELLNRPPRGWLQRGGSLMVSISILAPLFWRKAAFWLAVPTSIFCMTLLPIAYLTFFLLMNNRNALGDNIPRGGKRVAWNMLMAIATGAAAFGSIWSLWAKARWVGIGAMVTFAGLVLLVHFSRKRRTV